MCNYLIVTKIYHPAQPQPVSPEGYVRGQGINQSSFYPTGKSAIRLNIFLDTSIARKYLCIQSIYFSCFNKKYLRNTLFSGTIEYNIYNMENI